MPLLRDCRQVRQGGTLHCFGGELLLLASMLFVEYLIPIGASNSLSRWVNFGLDVGPPLAWLGSARLGLAWLG